MGMAEGFGLFLCLSLWMYLAGNGGERRWVLLQCADVEGDDWWSLVCAGCAHGS